MSGEVEEKESKEYDGKVIKITAVGSTVYTDSEGNRRNAKTDMLVTFSTNSFPKGYVSTVFDNYDTTHSVDGVTYQISLVDTAGAEDYDEIRQMSYEDADVILCCFLVTDPDTLEKVKKKWIEEIRHHCGNNPVVLVGLRSECDHEVKADDVEWTRVSTGCVEHIYCSSKTKKNLKKVFDTAVREFVKFDKKSKEAEEMKKMNTKKKKGGLLGISRSEEDSVGGMLKMMSLEGKMDF